MLPDSNLLVAALPTCKSNISLLPGPGEDVFAKLLSCVHAPHYQPTCCSCWRRQWRWNTLVLGLPILHPAQLDLTPLDGCHQLLSHITCRRRCCWRHTSSSSRLAAFPATAADLAQPACRSLQLIRLDGAERASMRRQRCNLGCSRKRWHWRWRCATCLCCICSWLSSGQCSRRGWRRRRRCCLASRRWWKWRRGRRRRRWRRCWCSFPAATSVRRCWLPAALARWLEGRGRH